MVEFALVLPLFLLLFAGIADFGFRLYELHEVQDGIRVAARGAAVGDVGTDTSCPITGASPPNTSTRKLVCLVKRRIGLDGADTRVKIVFGAGGTNEGQPILVCAQYPSGSITGLLPMFGFETLEANSVMRLEANSAVAAYGETSVSGSWSTCTL